MIAMPRAIVVAHLRRNPRDLLQLRSQVLPVVFAAGGLVIKTIELRVQNGALELAETIVPADLAMLIPLAAGTSPAVVNRANPHSKLVIVCHNDATLAARQVLARLEREAAQVPQRAHASPLVCCTMRMGRVLDDREPPPFGDLKDVVHAGREAAQVDGDYRPSPFRNRRLNGCRVYVESVGVDVHEYGDSVGFDHSRGCSQKRIGRHDNFVAGTDIRSQQRYSQRHGTAGHGYGMPGLVILGKPRLKTRALVPCKRPQLPLRSAVSRDCSSFSSNMGHEG